MAPAFAYLIRNKGINRETSYPYEAIDNTCRFNASNNAGSISSYVSLTTDEETLKEALASVGPIATAIDATLDSFFSYGEGVYFDQACTHNLSHAVLLVGYGTDPLLGDYWICKNTWVRRLRAITIGNANLLLQSTSWGEEGYFRIRRNANNHCGIGIYAVYPVV